MHDFLSKSMVEEFIAHDTICLKQNRMKLVSNRIFELYLIIIAWPDLMLGKTCFNQANTIWFLPFTIFQIVISYESWKVKSNISLSFWTNKRLKLNVSFGNRFGWIFIFSTKCFKRKWCSAYKIARIDPIRSDRNKQFFLWEMCKLTNEMSFTINLHLSDD